MKKAHNTKGKCKGISSEVEERLRMEILQQLKQVTAANSPNLYALLQSKTGYAQIEQQVIEKVISERIVPAAIIPQLETELSMY